MVKISQAPHPVRLEDVVFPEFNFKRNPNGVNPLKFPEFEIHASYIIESDDNGMAVVLSIKSKGKSKTDALSFNILAIALYKCYIEGDSGEILRQFGSQNTQYTLAWPYVRQFIARMVQEVGLPPYHIPLVLSWESEEEGKASTKVQAALAHSYLSK